MVKSFKILTAMWIVIAISTINIYGLENENSENEQIIKNIYNLKIE